MNEKIRKRQSYKNWLEWFDYFSDKVKVKKMIPEILFKLHKEIDFRNGYGSEQNSFWSEESLKLFLLDKIKYKLKATVFTFSVPKVVQDV